MNKIAAVVVTFNRLSLLKESIESLHNQTKKDFDIIVVNNGSTDGTKEWLDAQENIIVIHQDNCGGAGGFYTGQKYAYDHGYDWIWMMDDDGYTDSHQLEELFNVCIEKQIYFANATVINVEDRETLAFQPEIKYANLNGVVAKQCFAPYNGTFIHRSVFDKIGFNKKEMFIWGDEVEFTLRARKAGFDVVGVVKAIHYHPKNIGALVPAFPPFCNIKVVVKPKHFSHHYYRNRGYIEKQYGSWKVRLGSLLFNSLYFIRKGEFKELIKFYEYYLRGVRNEYS